MIQQARKNTSKSFLREAEFAVFIIEDEETRNYFLEKTKLVIEKRKDPECTLTGEKDLKTQILAFLQNTGEIKTINVWCRNIDIDKEKINELLGRIQVEFLNNGIQGILELHLQDREINSPHIQFIGNNAKKAEYIIAKTLVDLGYETSIENAIGKKDTFTPYYEINSKSRTQKLEHMLDYREKKEKIKENIQIEDIFENIEQTIQSSRNTLNKFKNLKNKILKRIENLKEFKNKIKNKMEEIRKIRKRIKRRR